MSARTLAHSIPIITAALLLLSAACSNQISTGTYEHTPPEGNQRQIGEVCSNNAQCETGFCISTITGKRCTIPCKQGCPAGWDCRSTLVEHSDFSGVCTPPAANLCSPCHTHAECNISGDLCAPLSTGSFCLQACNEDNDCPVAYSCETISMEDAASDIKQCVPDSGSCQCNEENNGLEKPCFIANNHGRCIGTQTCYAGSGWAKCQGRAATEEICNGIDDDCDGYLDDADSDIKYPINSPDGSCQYQGQCDSQYVCEKQAEDSYGWVCQAVPVSAELCDGQDNNCNGLIDEIFARLDGSSLVYDQSLEHCGACGNNCQLKLSHATGISCQSESMAKPECRALSCEDGYYLDQERHRCFPIVHTLCQACTSNDDCIAPNSLCIDNGLGEKFCGQDCSVASVFNGNPNECTGAVGEESCCGAGYVCSAYNDGSSDYKQCLPVTNTCTCNQTSLNLARSCYQQDPFDAGKECLGLQSCLFDDSGYAWEACSSEGFTSEICNYEDDDCDGQTDEDFINQNGTWLYDTDEHCGRCNNSCKALWVPDVHNAIGVCDISQYPLSCVMRCLEMYKDVNGNPDDGCECRKYGSVDLPDSEFGGYPSADEQYLDSNCDGIDGVLEDALFVSASHSGFENGSREYPYTSINTAITAFPLSGKRYILVAQGVYNEQIILPEGIQMHGGYASDFFSRNIVLYTSVINAPEPNFSGSYEPGTVNISCTNWSSSTTISGFNIIGYDVSTPAPTGQSGYSSYGLYVKDCNDSLHIKNCHIQGGFGGQGAAGADGTPGQNAELTDKAPNKSGLDGSENRRAGNAGPCQYSNPSTAVMDSGGSGGTNSYCNSTGMRGGNTYCPKTYHTRPRYNASDPIPGEVHKGNQADFRKCQETFMDCCFYNDPAAATDISCTETPMFCMRPDGASFGICAHKWPCTDVSDCPHGYASCEGSGDRYCELPAECNIDFDCPAGFLCNGSECVSNGYGLPGQAGFDLSYNVLRGSCNQMTESGFPSTIDSYNGNNGMPGSVGHAGIAGDGSNEIYGFFNSATGLWQGLVSTLSQGGQGTIGQSGGGGGGGGGVSYHPEGYTAICDRYYWGVGGGGGGAGGCGGGGGSGGHAGGASIALLIHFDSKPTELDNLPHIEDNLIERGEGGKGGRGGSGAYGGSGSIGANGANAVVGFTQYSSGSGGKGGNGGPGGGGGGGSGGLSAGLMLYNTPIADPYDNVFSDPALLISSGGSGGLGGNSPAAAQTGAAGQNGATMNTIIFCSTTPTDTCPAGMACVDHICE